MPTYTPNLTERFIYSDFINVMNSRAFTTLNIYVNSTTGVDTGQGRGSSPTSPWRSIRYALQDAFSLMHKSQVIIHLAGAADHEMPDGFSGPALLSADQVTLEVTPTFGFDKRTPLVIRATPTLVKTVAALAIVSQANNANSGLKEVTTSGLVDSELVATFGVDANGTIFSVAANTTTVISTCYAGDDLTGPLRFYSHGANIVPEDALSDNATLIFRGSTAPVTLEGVSVESSAGGGVQVGPFQQLIMVACQVADLSLGSSLNTDLVGPASVQALACNLGSVSLPSGDLQVSNSFFSAGSCTNPSPESTVDCTACTFSDMVTPTFGDQTTSPAQLSFTNCALLGGGLQSNIVQVGGFLKMATCDVSGAGKSGVALTEGARGLLNAVTSSATNTQYGLLMDEGAIVEVSLLTEIDGTLNQINIAGIGATDFTVFRSGSAPNNITSLESGCSLFEPGDEVANVREVTRNVTLSASITGADSFVTVDTTGASVTLILPGAAKAKGQTFTFLKKVAGNSMIIDGLNAETINGAATKTTATQFGVICVISDGTEWWMKSSLGTIT